MRQPKKPAPVRRAEAGSRELLWPPPVLDAEILWLDPHHAQASGLPGPSEPVRQVASRQDAAVDENGSSHAVRPAPWPTPAPATVKLSAILRAGVPFEWHDAIAIVQQLAYDAAPDVTRPPAGSIDLKSIGLEANGRVHAVIDRSSPEPIVCGLGRVLQMLLQHSPAPANLCAFVQQISHPDARASLRHWTSQLARWERPDRRGTLVALYERARNPVPGRRPNLALASGVASTPTSLREADDAFPIDEPETRSPRRERNPIAITVLAAVGCMLLGSIVTVLFMGESMAPPLPAKPAHDIELPAERVDGPMASPPAAAGTSGAPAQRPRLIDGRPKSAHPGR